MSLNNFNKWALNIQFEKDLNNEYSTNQNISPNKNQPKFQIQKRIFTLKLSNLLFKKKEQYTDPY